MKKKCKAKSKRLRRNEIGRLGTLDKGSRLPRPGERVNLLNRMLAARRRART